VLAGIGLLTMWRRKDALVVKPEGVFAPRGEKS